MKIDKVYTKRGDKGITSTNSSKALKKDDLVIVILGELDELNCFIGLAKHHLSANGIKYERISKNLLKIQKKLFDIGAELSFLLDKKIKFIKKNDIDLLENEINFYNKKLTKLYSFVLPGTGNENASFHVSRAVCRRVERKIVELNNIYKLYLLM